MTMDKRKIDKQKVARSFSRSAATYDQVAYLQRDVGNHLFNMLQHSCSQKKLLNKQDSARLCLDLGCGTGFFQRTLQTLEGIDNYIGLDIAEGMLHVAAYNNAVSDSATYPHSFYLCGDAERLPFSQKSIAVIFSNMALQWCEDLPRLVSECFFVLENDGVMAITTLGPSTLCELKAAWSMVDDRVHVNEFASHEHWHKAFIDGGLVVERHQKQVIKLQYQTVKTLLKELKLLGAHNVNEGQPQGLTLPKHLSALFAAYQKHGGEAIYPATYEVDYWIVRKSV